MKQSITALIVLIFLFGISCSPPEPMTNQSQWTAKDWIDYSIKHHDPKGNWSQFNSTIESFSKVDRGGETLEESNRNFKMDNGKSYFYLLTSVAEHPLEITIEDDNCTTTWEKKNLTTAEQNRYINNCAYGLNFRNYYRYLVGLPMVLKDDEAIIKPEVEDSNIEGKSYKKITVNYAPLNSNPTWEFYIDPTDGKLIRSVFIRFNNSAAPATGEIIDYPDHQTFQDIKLPKKMLWYHLDKKFLADETYVYKAI